MNKKFVVARLNARTFPMSGEEKQILSCVGADILEIEGGTDEEIRSVCKDAHAVMVVSAWLHGEVIRAIKNLKIISRLGTGIDKIDVEEATRQGVVVTNLPDFSTGEVADHTMALLLSVARQLKHQEAMIRRGKRLPVTEDLHRLSVTTLGIIGFGRIGRAVAKRARSFGMKILAYDPAVPAQEASREGAEKAGFEEVLKKSDYLCLLCPLNPSTREMITMKELKQMKPASVLINTGRGGLVNEDDLAAALRNRIIRYAAIDVFDGFNVFAADGFPVSHPYFSLDNILLTPHVAAISEESAACSKRDGAMAVADVLSGKTPAHMVNQKALAQIQQSKKKHDGRS